MRRWVLAGLLLVAGCGAAAPAPDARPIGPSTSLTPTATQAPTQTLSPTPPASSVPPPASSSGSPSAAALGTVPPAWLGTRALPRRPDGFGVVRPTPPELQDRRFTLPDTVAALPGTGFASQVTAPAPARVIARSTWAPGCPVAARDLAWVRLTFRGFDGARHTGELLVNRTAAASLVRVFHTLYDAAFPLEEMRITPKAEQTVPPTGDGNDTGAFNCRPVRGATTYSQHAYGLAVDVNPFQNPYLKGDLVLPELASAYRDRGWERPGMILPGGVVVRAFSAIGWGWGGSWESLKDLQHFSANSR